MLRNDFARYNLTDDESEDIDQDDFGWKIISTDVFRYPPHKSILSAVLGEYPALVACITMFVCAGNGSQFLALSVFIIILAILGMFNVHR